MFCAIICTLVLVGCSLLTQGCGEAEDRVHNILVVNDVYLYDDCDIYLDGSFQFTLQAEDEDSAVITAIPEGKHTITCKHEGAARWRFAEETFNLFQDMRWYTTAQNRRNEVSDVKISFIDIEEGSVEISDSSILCKITLNNLPEQLRFNNLAVRNSILEYSWKVKFDVDRDGSTNYELSVMHFHSGGAPRMGDILSNTQQTAWKKEVNSTRFISSIHASIEDNTIIFRADKSKAPDLASITNESKLSFHTYYNNGESVYRDELK